MQHIINKTYWLLFYVFESQRPEGTMHMAYAGTIQTPEQATTSSIASYSSATTPLAYAPRKRQTTMVAPKRSGGVLHLVKTWEGGTLHLAYQTQTPEPSTSVATTPLSYAPRKRQLQLAAPKCSGGALHLAAPLFPNNASRNRQLLLEVTPSWSHKLNAGVPVIDSEIFLEVVYIF